MIIVNVNVDTFVEVVYFFGTYYITDMQEPAVSDVLATSNSAACELLEHIVYINLDHRLDRKGEIEQELRRLAIPDSNIHRLSATSVPDFGALGCSHSHRRAIKLAQEMDWPFVLILEDDFMFRNHVTVDSLRSALQHIREASDSWDVVHIACRIVNKDAHSNINGTQRVRKAYTSSGYIVQKHYYATMIQLFEDSIEGLSADSSKNSVGVHTLDAKWSRLQQQDRWYSLDPLLGLQRPSYSDILRKRTAYNC